jgi:hypothetical protein
VIVLIVIALVLLVPREQVTGGRGYDRPPCPLKSPRAFPGSEEFSRVLRAMDYPLVGINLLLYLAFIAFLPCPTGVLGRHFENPSRSPPTSRGT